MPDSDDPEPSVEVLGDSRQELSRAVAYLERISAADDAPNPPGESCSWLVHDGWIAVTAMVRQDIVGITLLLHDSSWPARCPHYISAVYVDQPYRRRGLARQMIEAALSQIEAGAVQLFVPAENASARALYERLGFVLEVKVWHAGVAGSELAVMRLEPSARSGAHA